ncbi:hypothetical protein CYMTET_51123 [Cymbomonas tetramitiformis]|uniref:GPS domain-containing protein n=1 Tax=Cymbomonas tetramitiformis TaxID=36881 RepID=A0AAE0BMY7_9CHLO|nr:hypothetical protein CYMTET_51123 [Cymbomonas tetramitiformis]
MPPPSPPPSPPPPPMPPVPPTTEALPPLPLPPVLPPPSPPSVSTLHLPHHPALLPPPAALPPLPGPPPPPPMPPATQTSSAFLPPCTPLPPPPPITQLTPITQLPTQGPWHRISDTIYLSDSTFFPLPTPSPSVSATPSPTPPPSSSPTSYSTAIPTFSPTSTTESTVAIQTFTATFGDLSYTDLAGNSTFYTLFTSEYIASIAAGSGLPSDQVTIASIYAGSTVVNNRVIYFDTDLAAGADPGSFQLTLEDTTLLAALFSDSAVLRPYASSAFATSVTTTSSADETTATAAAIPPPPMLLEVAAPVVAGEEGSACAAAGAAACWVECRDVPAPGSGYTCAACPQGSEGDGVTCSTNLCYTGNGGCDTVVTCTMNYVTGTAECGECSSGKVSVRDPALVSGWGCADVDGCAAEPCWRLQGDPSYAQGCEDIPAPGSGRVCGPCPAGFKVADDGCADINECVEDNGGCWISGEDSTVGSLCLNTPGGHSCGECPEGYIGTGEAGCRERSMCHTDHGGCDSLSACTDNPATGFADCGPCPMGYSGTGATACVDADGCALEPCFPGVECADVAAPGEGRTCGSCPEGYRGDGASCEMCTLLMGLDAQMSTVHDGTMIRSAVNQLAGYFAGLSHPECVLTQGVQYLWEGSTSAGVTIPLDSTINMRDTLTLYLPKNTLTARASHAMRLTASLRGNPNVKAIADLSFVVRSLALVALIQGGGVHTGEGLPVLLDAGGSYDPDGEPEEMTYAWTCTRTIRTQDPGNDLACRDPTGTPLPSSAMGASTLNLTLAGSAEGWEYAVACTVSKADREARAETTLIIISGAPPVPAIAPLPAKHSANTRLTLRSQVASLAPETLRLAWSMVRLADGDGAEDTDSLVDVAGTALDLPELVVRAGSLSPGGRYAFTLTATDRNGPSWVTMEVLVNSPPHSGVMITPSPSKGVMFETDFAFEGNDWEDDPEDRPLWYQLRYMVVGGSMSTPVMLTQWQPSPLFSTPLPTAGLEGNAHAVTVYLYVRDALEATTRVSRDVAVQPMEFESAESQDAFVDGVLRGAVESMGNGADPSRDVLAMASLLSEADRGGGDARRHRRRRLLEAAAGFSGGANASAARVAQREQMLEVADAAWGMLSSTSDTVTRMAQTIAVVAADPGELSQASRAQYRATAAGLITVTRDGSSEAQLEAAGAEALVEGLSSVAAGALGGANQSAEVAAAVDLMGSLALSQSQGMVAGEDPAVTGTELLSSLVQRDDLAAAGGRLFSETVDAPSGATLQFQPSMRLALGAAAGSCVDLVVVGSQMDPHASSPASARLTASNVSSISLYSQVDSGELAVSGLEEAFTFTLPIELPGTAPDATAPPFLGAQCLYWDHAEGRYSSQGCTTLPNPTPPGTSAWWRSLNTSGLGALEEAWALADDPAGNLTAGCEEEWGAVFPEYLGADAGHRKYLGDGCQLTDSANAAGCWWEWRVRAFQGPGCVWAQEAGCLCTHLTDFAAVRQTEMGSAEPPDRVSTYRTDDMTDLSVQEVAKSVVLLSVLAIFMLGAPLLYCLSNWFHNRERLELLVTMMGSGEGGTFKEIDEMWTWSIVDREKYSGEKGGAPVTLGAAMASFANAEKERLDQERAGVRTSRLAASKWRARSTKFAMEDMAAIEEDEDSRPEDSETRAEKEEEVEDAPAIESELQQRVRKGWRWRNMFSGTAAAGLSRSLQPVAALENSFAPLVQAEEEKTEEEEKEEEEEGGRRMGLKYSDGFWSPPPASVASSGVAPNDMVGAHPLPPAEAEGGLSNASKTPSPSCAALPHGAYTVRWDAVNSATAARTPAGYPGVPDDSRAQLDTPDTIIMDIKHAKLKMAVPRLPPFVARYQMRNPRNRRILEDADQRTPKSSKGEHEVARETLTTRSAYSHVPNSRVTAVDPTGEAIQGSSPELMTTPAGSSVGRAADVLARTKMLRAARPSEGVAIEPAAPAKRLAQLKTAAPPAGYEMRIPGDLQISCDMADDLRRETASEKGSSPHGPPSSGPVMENYQLLGTWKEQVEEERARKRGEEEQGREERGSVAKSLHSIRQSIGASLMSTSDLKRAAAKRQKKKEAVSARVLFTSMKINVFRLQLSIPLDYLEQQAQLEMMDADRLSRRHSESARSKPGVSAAPQEPAVNRSIHPAGAPASRDFTAGTAMQGSSPELMTKMAEVLGSTKSFLADGPSEGVAVKPAAPAKAALCESRAAGVEKATSVKASHMWGMLRKRTLELPVERMLGTALVQAFLGIKAIVSKVDLAEQARIASMAPWQMPNNRPFSWYVSCFKVLIGSLTRDGWYQRARLWNVIFLQRVDGSFEMSTFLATMLKAGEPVADLGTNPLAAHDVAVLEASVPTILSLARSGAATGSSQKSGRRSRPRTTTKRHLVDRDSAAMQCLRTDISRRSLAGPPTPTSGEDGGEVAEHGGEVPAETKEEERKWRKQMLEVWATILVMQWLENLPFAWTENPNDPPKERVTLRGRSAMFIHTFIDQNPSLLALLPTLQEIADEVLATWQVSNQPGRAFGNPDANTFYHRQPLGTSRCDTRCVLGAQTVAGLWGVERMPLSASLAFRRCRGQHKGWR